MYVCMYICASVRMYIRMHVHMHVAIILPIANYRSHIFYYHIATNFKAED